MYLIATDKSLCYDHFWQLDGHFEVLNGSQSYFVWKLPQKNVNIFVSFFSDFLTFWMFLASEFCVTTFKPIKILFSQNDHLNLHL